MSFAAEKLDPKSGVARAAVASSLGQPGGHVLTEADIPRLLIEGSTFAEVAALQLTPEAKLRKIAADLVDAGDLPEELFSFLR